MQRLVRRSMAEARRPGDKVAVRHGGSHGLEHSRRGQQLARSNRDLERFASLASHDLVAPLAMVRLSLDLLNEEPDLALPALCRELLQKAMVGATRMNDTISSYLAFAKAGSVTMAPRRIDLARLLTEVVNDLAVPIGENAAQVRSQDLPTVVGDETLLRQLLQNLLANALRYRSAEPPVIEIRGESHDQGWTVHVRDNGRGIPAASQTRIFDLQRLRETGPGQGLGLGLAICTRIVERHGGRIWVESQPGCGSTFSFSLARPAEPSPDVAALAGLHAG